MPQIEPEPKQGAATPKSALKASMSEASSEPDPPATDSVFAALLAATHLQEYTTNLRSTYDYPLLLLPKIESNSMAQYLY